jgi:hypothetical protein
MKHALLAIVVTLAACGGGDDDGDDDGDEIDAALGAIDGGDDAIDAGDGIDASVCDLDVEPVDCAKDETVCDGLCASALCREFNNLGGSFCTHPCNNALQCPDGWSCPSNGNCRPPSR